MNIRYAKAKNYWKTSMSRLARITVRSLIVLLLLIISLYLGLAFYIHTHKKEVLTSVIAELNDNISGTVTIKTMEPTLLQGFPGVTLQLQHVTVRDSLYTTHKHTLLTAADVSLSLNILALIRGAVEIKKVAVSDAIIDMYTSQDGYSNGTIFRKKKPDAKKGKGGSFPELKKIAFTNVSFKADNRKTSKLYSFLVRSLKGSIDFNFNGWQADVRLKALAKSMAFNTGRGSFIKDKELDGVFDITYDQDKGYVTFNKNRLSIGGEDFDVAAKIGVGKSTDFTINIVNNTILWKNAANLLSPNITTKLMMFDIAKPISVGCDIVGNFNDKGDPLIRVNAKVSDNVLTTPGGEIAKCNFFGVFTNNYVKSKGYNDANSAIKLFNFTGEYGGLPFVMKEVKILDLEEPVAVGDFSSSFAMENLKSLVDDDLLKFTGGTAQAKMKFRADIVNYKLAKPFVEGTISVTKANIIYVPRKLEFKDVSLALNFDKDDLYISTIALKTGRSIVNMKGSVHNFLNLYYTDPQKLVLQWQIYSPQLHLGEFMAFLGTRKRTQAAIKKTRKGNFTDDLNLFFEKSNVDMKLKVDKLYYNNFYATNAHASVLLTDQGAIVLKDAGLNHAGGTLAINGLMEQGTTNKYRLDATVSNVNVAGFFKAFDNFGLESLTEKNLNGSFSAKAIVSGRMTDDGKLVPKSMDGTVNFNLKKGRLINFGPLQLVGKLAFPFRDVKNIEFYDLKGKLDIRGEKVTILPMQINSSVLNMDIEGVYSFGKGTRIYVDVPLRNPKKDKDITDENELAKRRNRGIVVHLTAQDGDDGKVGISLGGKK